MSLDETARAEFANSPGQLANSLMDELVARATRQLERLRDLGDRMSEIRVTEVSSDGAVTVTVDGNGTMLDLVLSPVVNSLTPEEFDEAVVGTAGRAAASAFARRGELVTEFEFDSYPSQENSPAGDGVRLSKSDVHDRVTRS